MANEVRVRASVQDHATRPINNIRDAWTRFQKEGSQGVKAGLTAAVAVKAFNLLQSAIGGVTDMIGEATQAYIADERSQRQLGAALSANVEAWDGNVTAIEKVLDARLRLGFSDDEQRESLRGLVAAYGDVTKALEVQRLAMDLARFSGVDLATASDVLIKVHAGNFRALKALGINTKYVTTETQALAAIQKIAGGQAETYADTLEGRLAVAATKSAEAVERLGQATAEFSADFETAKAGAIENFVTGLDTLVDGLNISSQSFERQIELQKIVISLNPVLTQQQKNAAIAWLDHAAALRRTADLTKDDLVPALEDLTDASRGAKGPASDLARILDDMGYEAGDADRAIDDLSSTITNDLFGDAINDGNLAQLRDTNAELNKQRDAAKASSREYTILTGRIAENEQAQFDLQLQMAQEEGPDALLAFLDEAYAKYGTNNARITTMINKLKALYGLLVKYDDLGVITFGRYEGKEVPLYHGGTDYVPKTGPAILKQGEAVLDPEKASAYRSGDMGSMGSMGSWSGGGAPVVIALNLDGREVTRIVDRHLYYAGGRSHYLPD